MFEDKKQEEANVLATNNPQPGDYFHEMYSYHLIVLKIKDGIVYYTDGHGTKDHPWVLHQKPQQEFHDYLQYDTLKEKYWVDYAGCKHKKDIPEFLKHFELEDDVDPYDHAMEILK